jgi:hypothetical protein
MQNRLRPKVRYLIATCAAIGVANSPSAVASAAPVGPISGRPPAITGIFTVSGPVSGSIRMSGPACAPITEQVSFDGTGRLLSRLGGISGPNQRSAFITGPAGRSYGYYVSLVGLIAGPTGKPPYSWIIYFNVAPGLNDYGPDDGGFGYWSALTASVYGNSDKGSINARLTPTSSPVGTAIQGEGYELVRGSWDCG